MLAQSRRIAQRKCVGSTKCLQVNGQIKGGTFNQWNTVMKKKKTTDIHYTMDEFQKPDIQ